MRRDKEAEPLRMTTMQENDLSPMRRAISMAQNNGDTAQSASKSSNDAKNLDRLAYKFGHDKLGPIVAYYLFRLHSSIQYFANQHNAKVLFISRAGVRIRGFYDAFTTALQLDQPVNIDYLWASRLMIAKGLWQRNRNNSLDLLLKEFRYGTVGDLVRASLHAMGDSAVARSFQGEDLPASEFGAFLQTAHPVAEVCRMHLEEQGSLFERYLADLLGQHDRVLLVDTGWQGTAQRMLADAYPDIEWWGAYFGRFGFPDSDYRYWHQMIGLIFEGEDFHPERPETGFTQHRHMIESLFEPNAPSIERLAIESEKGIFAPGAAALLAEATTLENDAVYMGAMAYVQALTSDMQPGSLFIEAQRAFRQTARIILYPSLVEAKTLGRVERSQDFGRTKRVPLLLAAEERFAGDTSEARIADSLWPQGQVALEYPDDMIPHRQKQLLSSPVALNKILQPVLALPHANLGSERQYPAVAIITRTMDRPIFLRRAIESVANQSFGDYVHVIVSDGGEIEHVRKTVETSGGDLRKIILIDNVINRGMEAASNIGIDYSKSEFIVIHDDDDTWESEFLAKTVDFMRSSAGLRYGGVISKCSYISEEVSRDGIKIHAKAPYNDWVENVSFIEMSCGNFFAPIQFLFRRSVCSTIGGFDESLPVLGDWDFNLRFLTQMDIGVLPEAFANYHHRDRNTQSLFQNSVIGTRKKHAEFNSIVRNKFFRKAETGNPNLALPQLGLLLSDVRGTLQKVASMRDSNDAIHSLDTIARHADDRWIAVEILFKQVRELSAERDHFARLADDRWLALQSRLTGLKFDL